MILEVLGGGILGWILHDVKNKIKSKFCNKNSTVLADYGVSIEILGIVFIRQHDYWYMDTTKQLFYGTINDTNYFGICPNIYVDFPTFLELLNDIKKNSEISTDFTKKIDQ